MAFTDYTADPRLNLCFKSFRWFIPNMAVNLFSQSSLLQPKASVSLKPQQFQGVAQDLRVQPPHSSNSSSRFFSVTLLLNFSLQFWYKCDVVFTSDVRSVAKLENRFLPKASAGVLESNANSPVSASAAHNPIIVIDNYDSFTYNLCQVFFFNSCIFFADVKEFAVCIIYLDRRMSNLCISGNKWNGNEGKSLCGGKLF